MVLEVQASRKSVAAVAWWHQGHLQRRDDMWKQRWAVGMVVVAGLLGAASPLEMTLHPGDRKCKSTFAPPARARFPRAPRWL